MATVWEAVDEILARRVAVKVLHPHLASDQQFVARFRREAVAAARLSHPAIVSIYDTCTDHGVDAIVMELVRGTTLRAELDRRGRFEPEAAAAVVAEIADALSCAHEAGIVHRDIKPANVLLSTDGRVLVTDFGIAKAGDGLDLTGTNMTLGTAKYLAPEQVEGGPVDARADIYATGVILYELVCGRPPFVADGEAATALARLHRDPEPPRSVRPDVDPALEAIVQRAMARDPDGRFPDAGSLRSALRGAMPGGVAPTTLDAIGNGLSSTDADATRAVDATSVGTTPPATPPADRPSNDGSSAAAPTGSARKDKRPRRRKAPYVLAALVLVAVGTALVLIGQSGREGGDGTSPNATRPASEGGGLQAAGVTDFDPAGDGSENGDLTGAVIDGDPGTFWRTECYRAASLEGFKPGVGLVVELTGTAGLDQLVLDTRTPGWTAEIRVGEDPATWSDPGNLGPVAGTIDGAPTGTAAVDLGGAEGRYVLIWITGFGQEPSPDCERNPYGVTITELSVVGSV
jgi:eukaryotic-like serine/threonine-protein kinase